MSKFSFFILSFFFSLFVAGCAYFMTGLMVFLITTFISYFVVFFFLIRNLIDKHLIRERIRHETYKFINSFIINLSVSNSIEKAFKSGSEGLSKEYFEVVKNLNASFRDKTYYLVNYFDSSLYRMFLNILSLYEEQGGDILKLSSSLLLETARIEEGGNLEKKNRQSNLREYLTMWLLAFAIFLFTRFGLSSFYDFLRGNIVFLSGVGIFLGFLLVSILVYCSVYTNAKFRKAKVQAKEKYI